MGFSKQEYWSGLPLPSPSELLRLPFFPSLSVCLLPFTSHSATSLSDLSRLAAARSRGTLTPFNFGMNHRTPPYPAGDYCLLCRSERKDASFLESGVKTTSKLALSMAPKGNSVLHLPLWVCPDCRRAVEKDARHGGPEQPAQGQDFLLHTPLSSQTEAGSGGRLALGAQPMPVAAPADPACACEACSERREISAEAEREPQQLQNYWSEVRYTVRCIYRQAGTPLADDQDQSLVPDRAGVKELVDRLCERDPYQLYQRLEQQAREYVLEMKVRLLRQLSAASRVKPPSGLQGPPQAHQFISLLLEEYGALCQAARTISSFLGTLENEHLKKFQVTWELHNKHLFEDLVFSEPLLQSNLPALVSQIRLGTTTHDGCCEDTYSALLQRFQRSEEELRAVAAEWLQCQKRIDAYVDEQMTMKTKQRMLTEDWELFKQRRFIEEQFTKKKAVAGENSFTDTMRHVLSSRLSVPDCPNCNYRRRCACDDCSLSHILTCGIVDPPAAGDIHIHQLPLPVDAAPDCLSEMRPPGASSASSGSASSSPITVQQHPRLILTDNGSAPTFCSDDEDVAPLSAKFADIYPLSNYEDAEVVASMNGVHGELNGGGENLALKDESPQVSSTSSSSSEADDEEADGESSGEPPGAPKEDTALGSGSPRKEESKVDSPPPSYPAQQAEQAPNTCECHVCKQEASGLTPSAMAAGALPPGHQFLSPEKPAHPALHLYPHIHGHVPLHAVPHLPRPLIHPTLYTAPPFTHSKALPPAPVQNHTNKHQVFSASLQDHIYPSCFGSTPEWTSSKFISLWGSEVMNDKNWNPGTYLPDTISGSDLLGPTLSEARPEALPPPSSSETAAIPDNKERKSAARKKCLYNFQDAFMEANKVVMATSSATSSVSCTATTVQSSSSQFRVSSKRPPSLGDVFHGINKEDHRHGVPAAPRSSPTGLAPLPALAPAALSAASTPHLANIAAVSFPKTAASPGFVESLKSFCPAPVAPPPPTTDGSVSAPPSVCSDPDCEGHRCENGVYDPQQDDGDESADEDSCSEHSSSTSTSTNQKEGKYCDCCYCEFFGHGGPPAAPTSRNYAEMREKLRLRLTKRKEEQPKKADQLSERESVVDHRRVEDLLQFINSSETKPVSSTRAAKRARHKQRKLEEKARLEAEARARGHLHLREEQRRRADDERLTEELQRLQELQTLRAVKKKKKERLGKDCPKLDMLAGSFQAAAESAPGAETIHNGSLEPTEDPETSSPCPSRHADHAGLGPGADPSRHVDPTEPVDAREAKRLLPKGISGEQPEPLSFLLDMVHHHKGGAGPQKPRPGSKAAGEPARKPTESPRAPEGPARPRPQAEPKARVLELPPLVGHRREETKVNSNNNNRKQLNHVREEKPGPGPAEPPVPSEPLQSGKPATAESPQPKGRGRKSKKKKGERASSSIDDVFLPKDIDLDSVDMDETEREVEYFKRFCLDSARQTRQRLSINWSNFSLKKATFAAH
ncbi:protein FAM193A isoform X1 [Bubalus kerabau]|uniref:protein FAM193A isoform X1 n=2 Tax=Bubalus carabanensis TaxID=3119969 RepID=UPI00244E692D|nr:protein FAM193A isoform X1 [Bubalus carabanensis]XP_055445231.1 protein FAM193A isoform X1 [Bubalus carabanensis]XP_055445232.1 protein FAM193A isoform X1 [Bubalus carabanensis]